MVVRDLFASKRNSIMICNPNKPERRVLTDKYIGHIFKPKFINEVNLFPAQLNPHWKSVATPFNRLCRGVPQFAALNRILELDTNYLLAEDDLALADNFDPAILDVSLDSMPEDYVLWLNWYMRVPQPTDLKGGYLAKISNPKNLFGCGFYYLSSRKVAESYLRLALETTLEAGDIPLSLIPFPQYVLTPCPFLQRLEESQLHPGGSYGVDIASIEKFSTTKHF